MGKERLGLDVDDVLSPLWELLLAMANERFGTKHALPDLTGYMLRDNWPHVTEEEDRGLLAELFASPAYLDPEPLAGAREAIVELREAYDIYLITSRLLDLRLNTLAWIDGRFGRFYEDAVFLATYGGGTVKKSEICSRVRVNVFIDDNLAHAIDCAPCVDEVILFDHEGQYGWNKDMNRVPPVLRPKIIRKHSWPEIVAHLLARARRRA